MPEDDTNEKDAGASDPRREGLFITDAELIRRLGVPERIARDALKALDAAGGRRSGFPQKLKLWGNRRYWPAVKAYFDAHYGVAPRVFAPRNKGPSPEEITASVRRERESRPDFDLRNYKSIFDK
jgi:hypothetical protein